MQPDITITFHLEGFSEEEKNKLAQRLERINGAAAMYAKAYDNTKRYQMTVSRDWVKRRPFGAKP